MIVVCEEEGEMLFELLMIDCARQDSLHDVGLLKEFAIIVEELGHPTFLFFGLL